MSKKILTIFLSLFLVGIFSISCSNSDKTGSTIDDSKGIEQFNGNTYVSTKTFDASGYGPTLTAAYAWVSVKDGKLAIRPDANDATAPSSFDGFYIPTVNGSGADYTFDSGDGRVSGTLKFTDTSVTVRFTKNTVVPDTIGKDIVCNKK
ncbi:hypothetical protein [Brachyspira pilosicoli]|uniref:Lipoprotein n=1 Tax=Brachyspira pilosicoli TaxID=52584 RepID=A0A5C8EC52_BRAPL|nr:hypothetical protein [Brachyspira pilosicoli]TXJ35637.1 hypothetical protein EPJ72_12325 [Brachyspira pilosicoli]